MDPHEIVHTAVRNIGEAYGATDMVELAGILASLAAQYLDGHGVERIAGDCTGTRDGQAFELPFVLLLADQARNA